MSRIGVKPIKISPEVSVTADRTLITVKGPKGTLTSPLPAGIKMSQEDGKVVFGRTSNEVSVKALHGLARSLFNNAVIGVTTGFQKRLELVGTGYRVKAEGQKLVLSLGLSHTVDILPVSGIEFTVEGNNIIYVKGIDKHLVGQVSADIRAHRPPEPYKGKGIRYSDEVVRRKAGKAAKGGEK